MPKYLELRYCGDPAIFMPAVSNLKRKRRERAAPGPARAPKATIRYWARVACRTISTDNDNTKPSARMGRKTIGSLRDSRGAEISIYFDPGVFFVAKSPGVVTRKQGKRPSSPKRRAYEMDVCPEKTKNGDRFSHRWESYSGLAIGSCQNAKTTNKRKSHE